MHTDARTCTRGRVNHEWLKQGGDSKAKARDEGVVLTQRLLTPSNDIWIRPLGQVLPGGHSDRPVNVLRRHRCVHRGW